MAFTTERWTLANILPVIFVAKIVLSLELLYVFLHLIPLLQSSGEAHQRGVWQTALSQTFAFLVFVSLMRAITTNPGSVPSTPEWQAARSNTQSQQDLAAEVKQTGGARFCKWCNHYKPDRCHHCRVCRSCILRMDHHCPWIANCVGFHNHKFFLLLVFYGMLSALTIVSTMFESVDRAINEEMTTLHRFAIVYCMTLATLMSMLLVPFFLLHLSFMAQSQSTIEFCEGRSKKSAPITYDRGLLENARATLGPHMIFWLLPFSMPEGDGLTFPMGTSEGLLGNQHGTPDAPASQETPDATTPKASPSDVSTPGGSSDKIKDSGGDVPKEKVVEVDEVDTAPEVTGARAAVV